MLAYLLLGVAQVVGLLIIPLGAPGVWVQLAALALYGWWTDFAVVGVAPLLVLLLAALTAELVEPPLAGGRIDPEVRRRLAWGGLAGSGVGALFGFYFPLLGSIFGAAMGALVGTLLGSIGSKPGRIGCAALGGQVMAMTTKTAAGAIVAIFTVLTLLS